MSSRYIYTSRSYLHFLKENTPVSFFQQNQKRDMGSMWDALWGKVRKTGPSQGALWCWWWVARKVSVTEATNHSTQHIAMARNVACVELHFVRSITILFWFLIRIWQPRWPHVSQESPLHCNIQAYKPFSTSFFLVLGPYLALLWMYSQFYTQSLFLLGLRGGCGMPGIRPGLAACKACLSPFPSLQSTHMDSFSLGKPMICGLLAIGFQGDLVQYFGCWFSRLYN